MHRTRGFMSAGLAFCVWVSAGMRSAVARTLIERACYLLTTILARCNCLAPKNEAGAASGERNLAGGGLSFTTPASMRLRPISHPIVKPGFTWAKPATLPLQNRRPIMPSYSPELIQTMRAALDEAMTKIPVDQASVRIKAHMAELILKAAADGQTSHEGLVAAALDQIQTICK